MFGLFVLFCFASASTVTDFNFIGNLTCNSGADWCFKVSYEEIDLLKNDNIVKTTRVCTNETQVITEAKGKEEGDGFFDKEYELVAVVDHNCTTDGKWKELKVHLPEVSTDKKKATVKYTENVTNKEKK